MGAQRAFTHQLPGARCITEWFTGQGANGANINHVAGELRVNRLTNKGGDLRMLATINHAQLHHTSDLLTKAYTAGAMNAA